MGSNSCAHFTNGQEATVPLAYSGNASRGPSCLPTSGPSGKLGFLYKFTGLLGLFASRAWLPAAPPPLCRSSWDCSKSDCWVAGQRRGSGCRRGPEGSRGRQGWNQRQTQPLHHYPDSAASAAAEEIVALGIGEALEHPKLQKDLSPQPQTTKSIHLL